MQLAHTHARNPLPISSPYAPGAYRQPYGSEFLAFYGSTEPNVVGTNAILRPRLTIVLSSSNSGVPHPLPPLYPAPASAPGVVVASNATAGTLTYTCEGGKTMLSATSSTPLAIFAGACRANTCLLA
jgi:hypothetical protein